jgi:hypothetical protein
MSIPPAGRTRVPSRILTEDLRLARAVRRDSGADLVPVEGGEPMPAEDPESPEESAPCR